MNSDDLDALERVDGISRNPHYNSFVAVMTEILAGYVAALETLDDRTVNRSPVPGTVNTAFALVTHVHGMAHYWGGAFVAGEDIPRNRDAEFRASGTVAEAHVLIEEVRGRLPAWARVALTEGIRNPEATGTSRRDVSEVTPEWVLEHILHELAQHLGHLEVCRDVVTSLP